MERQEGNVLTTNNRRQDSVNPRKVEGIFASAGLIEPSADEAIESSCMQSVRCGLRVKHSPRERGRQPLIWAPNLADQTRQFRFCSKHCQRILDSILNWNCLLLSSFTLDLRNALPGHREGFIADNERLRPWPYESTQSRQLWLAEALIVAAHRVHQELHGWLTVQIRLSGERCIIHEDPRLWIDRSR